MPQKPAFGPPKPIPAPAVHDDPAWHTIDYHAQEHARASVPGKAAHRFVKPAPLTLLDEVGRLDQPLDAGKVAEWKRQLHRPRLLSSAQTAKLHLWLGEYLLAHDEQPEAAEWHFEQAQKMSKRTQAVYGVAAYDKAIAAFYEGAYNQALGEFKQVLASRPSLHGFDHSTATLFLRHASACAGYHGERAAAGIPEPPKLDPLCGAAAVAIALKTAGKPYDKKTVLANLHVTGRGSSLQDVIDGAKKLGFAAHVVSVGDKGLIALPKPLVAYVEHDHFISVLDADKRGVTYMCSDCGAWPGGKVNLTWQQWHKLEATHYAVLTTPNSDTDEVLSLLKRTREQGAQGIQLASLSHNLSGDVIKQTRLLKRFQVSFPFPEGGLTIYCGFGPASQHCASHICCPKDGPAVITLDAPSAGDPVNLATGEEEYTPGADLSVYNPVGPSVNWGRLYNSLRGYGSNAGYQNNDLGQGWSHPYNLGVVQTAGAQPVGGAQPAGGTPSGTPQATGGGNGLGGYLLEPNGARYTFTLSALPTAAVPSVSCTLPNGVPMRMTCNYNSATSGYYYVITLPDRTQLITQGKYTNTPCTNPWYPLGQMVDRNGNGVTFNYAQTAGNYPLLTTITDKNGTALLTFNRAANGTGNLTSVADRYGRSVYYHVGTYATTNVPQGLAQSQQELDHVSQVVLTGTASPPDRYAYGYQNVGNGEGTETVPMLHTITVPSPTGTGTKTATINYSSNATIASLVDANGNSRSYQQVDANHTQVTIKDPQNNIVYRYTAGYDMNMSQTTTTNGVVDANGHNTQIVRAKTYADPNDPYRPSQTQDGNGYAASGVNGKGTWTYTWDQFGNCLMSISPRSTQVTNTYSYTNFALGELTKTQVAGKQATTFAYFEPSGNVQSVTSPLPGTVNGTQHVTTSYTYSALGNLLTVTSPGNGTVASMTTTYGYTADGTYSQNEALRQPLTITNNLGKITHARYDVRGNPTSVMDPLGYQADGTYNIANQIVQVNAPPTGQTGTGRAANVFTYLYPGGPATVSTGYDEGGNQVRQVTGTLGAEGETLSVSGSTEPTACTYDALYRTKIVKDGNNSATTYVYNTSGYLSQVSAPLANGAYDTIQLTAYDANGNILTRIDGRGTTTNYVYNDPESRLTDVQYPSNTALNVHCDYDAYGRPQAVTDGVGVRSSVYDDLDGITSITTTYTGQTPKTLSYTYYANGTRQTMVTPAGTFSYSYDGIGRPTSLTNPFNETSSWTSQDNDQFTTQTLGNGVTTTLLRNALGEQTDVTSRTAGGTILSRFSNLTYDAAGNRQSMTSAISAAPTFSGVTSDTNDAKNQLTQEHSLRTPPGYPSGYNNVFGYDGAGNSTTYKGVTKTFNADNQSTANTYDGNGNPTVYNGTTLTFDPENRLTSYGTSMTAGYTAEGLRAWKQGASGRTYFLYDADEPILELSASGNVLAVNTFGALGLLSRHTSTGSTFYTFDPQGSVTQRLDANANVLSSDMYSAQGTGASTSVSADPFGFNAQWGYYTDGETGLQLLTHRYYDFQHRAIPDA